MLSRGWLTLSSDQKIIFVNFLQEYTFVQYGEKCGGFANAEGVCSGGLGCLVSFQIIQISDDNLIGFFHTR